MGPVEPSQPALRGQGVPQTGPPAEDVRLHYLRRRRNDADLEIPPMLPAYDGVVWTVADPVTGGPGEFFAVDSQLPLGPQGTVERAAKTVSYTIEIQSLRGPWVFRAGDYADGDQVRADEPTDIRFNPETTTLAIPAGVTPGMKYRIDVLERDGPSDGELLASSVTLDADTRDARVATPTGRQPCRRSPREGGFWVAPDRQNPGTPRGDWLLRGRSGDASRPLLRSSSAVPVGSGTHCGIR